jgi:uncharacterized phage-associated protein
VQIVTAHDVAAFIREEQPHIARLKLLKLVYYAQAWSIVWDDAPLFADVIEAWPDGPVVRELWAHEQHGVTARGDVRRLTVSQQATVREVLRVYGKYQGDWLSSLTHREEPWIAARDGFDEREKSRIVITTEALRRYYGALGMAPKTFTPAFERGLRLLVSLAPEEAAELVANRRGDDWRSGDELLQMLEG